MSPIDPLSSALARIQAQALAKTERKGAAQKPAAQREGAAAPRSGDPMAAVLTAVGAIPGDVPDRPERAFRLYVQAVLARELGLEDVNAPDVQELVDRVMRSIAEDAGLGDEVRRAGEVLVERAGKRS
jgi:hypothetical protein